jgi:hypothetical protein
MAARANPFFDITDQPAAEDVPEDPHSAIARLARVHADAQETARLSKLLGRSPYAAIALPLAAGATIWLSKGVSAAPCVAWAVLVMVAGFSIARAYASSIRQPLERPLLQAFARDLSAVILYAGFAWGAGAFLVLSRTAPIGSALVFAVAPALGLGAILRERNAVVVFLAPVAALTSFACVLRPFTPGAMNAAFVLIACAVVAWALSVVGRRQTQAP